MHLCNHSVITHNGSLYKLVMMSPVQLQAFQKHMLDNYQLAGKLQSLDPAPACQL